MLQGILKSVNTLKAYERSRNVKKALKSMSNSFHYFRIKKNG